MLPRPVDVDLYTKACIAPGSPPPGSILFLTTRLPDCRRQAGKMTWRRSQQAWHGVWAANGPQFFGTDHWDKELERQLAAHPKTPILYIHGFNNDNGEALARAAAIRLAAGNDRPVIALTWPSYASKRKYFWDESNAEWTATEAGALIAKLAGTNRKVVIVAHSMGNRIAFDLVRTWPAQYPGRPIPVERLIMASPDVDRDWFIRVARQGLPVPVTLYGSTRDQPLSASWRSHAHPRAGDLSRWVTGNDNGDPYKDVNHAGLDIVDTSPVARGLLKHADFIESWQGAAALCRVINGKSTDNGRLRMTNNMEQLYEKPVEADTCTGHGEEAVEYLGR